ncbi:MAG TPA: hypothetical protein VLE96_07630 [Chlamydiales bacterium]|nr:hypothetical protein [Chlamydiales bacterium]
MLQFPLKKPFLALILFLTSCATTYHREGFFGDGYSEIITNRDSFIVTFKGNEFTSAENALRFALLRASELTLANGYNYFAVISEIDRSSSYNYITTRTDASAKAETKAKSVTAEGNSSKTTYSGAVTKPATSIKIKCYYDKPEIEDVIDAQFYWQNNKEK